MIANGCRDSITCHVIDPRPLIADASVRADPIRHWFRPPDRAAPPFFNDRMEPVMSAHTDLIDRYFDTWNQTDAAKRRDLIAATWTVDGVYLDPLLSGDGHEGIDAMIRAVQERFPGHVFRRTTQVDGFANRVRFSWMLTTPDGNPIVKGSDFGIVDAGGRLQAVTGFLDVPPGGA
jgi:hypothetical protein